MRRPFLLGLLVVPLACGKGSTLTSSPGHLSVLANGGDVSGGSADFGQCCPGFPVQETFTLSNTGDVQVNVKGLQITGDFSANPAPSFPLPIGPGESSTLNLTFAPQSGQSGGQAGTLTVTSDAQDGSVVVSLTGTVSSGPSQPTFQSTCTFSGQVRTPCSLLDFGSVSIGASASQTMTVQNLGCPPLTVAASLIADGGYTLGAVPTSIQFGQSAPVTLTFAPTSSAFDLAELLLSTNDPQGGRGQDAGQFVVMLTGEGTGMGSLTLSPLSWAAAAGGPSGQTFTVQNASAAAVALEPPGIVELDDAGAFQLDAGWAAGFVLDAGSSVTCVVTADLPGAGAFGATLVVPYGTSQLSANLTGNAISSLCTTSTVVFESGLLCGPPITESLQLAVCDGGNAPVEITSISVAPNAAGLYTLNLPAPSSGPWTVTPGGAGLPVGVVYQNNGSVQQADAQLVVASDAFSQPTLNVPITNAPAYVPPAIGVPVLVDGGPLTVGTPLLFQVQPSGAPSYAYQFYWVGHSTGADAPDAGLTVLSGVAGADLAFTPEVVTSGTNNGYRVCVEELELDAGQGSCGFDAGTGTGTSLSCSQVIVVGS